MEGIPRGLAASSLPLKLTLNSESNDDDRRSHLPPDESEPTAKFRQTNSRFEFLVILRNPTDTGRRANTARFPDGAKYGSVSPRQFARRVVMEIKTVATRAAGADRDSNRRTD